jgi:hypothetical protein
MTKKRLFNILGLNHLYNQNKNKLHVIINDATPDVKTIKKLPNDIL